MGTPGKPRVAVFTLGGTIAMRTTPGEGAAPALSASDLLAAVPGLDAAGVELRLQDVANKPGASLSFSDLLGLADAISAASDDGFTGMVVIQGTDTIEETAYLLDLLVASDAPVVVTGACAIRRWLDRTARRTSWQRSGSRLATAHEDSDAWSS